MNELDKLRAMLDEAQIPYENYQEEFSEAAINILPEHYSGNNKYLKNQIVYGRFNEIEPGAYNWKIDGVCQYGSYGADKGLIETYGEFGVDGDDEPLVLNAEDVFAIIKEDWERTHGQN